jgi:hypothetical protein
MNTQRLKLIRKRREEDDDNHQGHNHAGNTLRDQIAMQMWNDFPHEYLFYHVVVIC